MNLAALETRLRGIVGDTSFSLVDFINNAILELAADIDLPTLKTLRHVDFSVTDDNWMFSAPDTFHKKIFRALDSRDNMIRHSSQRKPLGFDYLENLYAIYHHHHHAPHVRVVASADTGGLKYIGVFPRANETIKLWFYQKPPVLEEPDDECFCIPPEYHDRVLISKAVLIAHENLTDLVENLGPSKQQNYWLGRLADGLNGRVGGSIGLINYLTKISGDAPRRHGGRD